MVSFESDIAQLFARRLGITEEQLAELRGGAISGLSTHSASDPLAAGLLAWLARTDTGQERAASPREHDALEQVHAAIRALQLQVLAANARVDHVAEALGACPECWGTSASCARCGGRGKPGYAYPMKDQLLSLIGPALAVLGLRIVDSGFIERQETT
jgi:hypothetical protein